MVRVVFHTDEPIAARGITAFLEQEEGFEVVTTSCQPPELPATLAMHKPDILLLDYQGVVSGNLISVARRAAPRCKCVLWVRRLSVEQAYQAIQLGARGILQKTSTAEQLQDSLRKIADGQLAIDASLASELPDVEAVALTIRESQLLKLVARGMKNREMAKALSITEGTVKVYLSRLFQKAGVRDRYQLALYGIRNLGVPAKDKPVHALEYWPKSLVVTRHVN
jgi:DNA-binding NarL/FixJ family response regulator